MPSFKPLPLLVSAVFLFAHLLLNTEASDLRRIHSLEARYSRAHSLGNNYHFSTRDGWQTVNVTNLQYKYRRDFVDDHQTDEGVDGVQGSDDIFGSIHSASSYGSYRSNSFGLARRASRKTFNPAPRPQSKAQAKAEAKSKVDAARESKDKNKTSSKASDKNNNKGSNKSSQDSSNDSGKGLTSSVKAILASLKGTGKAEPVTITWCVVFFTISAFALKPAAQVYWPRLGEPQLLAKSLMGTHSMSLSVLLSNEVLRTLQFRMRLLPVHSHWKDGRHDPNASNS